MDHKPRIISIKPREVLSHIKILVLKKATCPDKIPVVVVMKIISELSLIVQPLSKGETLPNVMECVQLMRSFQEHGLGLIAYQYRPISLLGVISKPFKDIINKNVFEYVNKDNILKDKQYGFRWAQTTADSMSLIYSYYKVHNIF